jgi:hypothetical protein
LTLTSSFFSFFFLCVTTRVFFKKVMSNADAVAQFLPPGAPLSTFRVMTGSRLGIPSTGSTGRAATRQQQSTSSNGGDSGVGLTAAGKKAKKSKKGGADDENENGGGGGGGGGTTGTTDSTGGSSGSGSGGGDPGVFAFSCVFRAGRAGGLTDHDSVLFDVDQQGKKMGVGTSNMHWYQLGPGKALTTPWLNNNKFTHHPDGQIPVMDQPIVELDKMLKVRSRSERMKEQSKYPNFTSPLSLPSKTKPEQ